MDRMSFIPGAEAREEIHKAEGHIFFQRPAALSYADEFLQAPAFAGASESLPVIYQTVLACLSDGDQVDVWFGLRDAEGQDELPSGEPVGHTWATLKTADGKETPLWEVGRGTPSAGEAHAVRAFNAYRQALAAFKGEQQPSPLSIPMGEQAAYVPQQWNGKPAISRALAPANLYYGSARMWYFVELGGSIEAPVISRPMRAFDALILSALMALAQGRPPMVFAVANTMETLGKLPLGYVTAGYEADKTLERPPQKALVVM